jgi:hypothetical protein
VPDKGEVGYETVALFNDIPLPEIKNINGNAKFINRNNGYFIGYKINFDIAHLDTTKINAKYLRNKPEVVNGINTTALGIKEVTYDISFEFTLIDKDGFEIEKIKSATETVQSGEKNEFQNTIEKPVSLKTIESTKSIKLILSIDKCLNCDTN